MGRPADVRRYTVMATTVANFLRSHRPLPVAEATAEIRKRMATRNERFLQVLDACVWSHAASPYLPLLRAAGCERGDVTNLVRREGLEGTLLRLRSEGVYFSFEEFRGRRPVQRGSLSFEVTLDTFDNPNAARDFSRSTSGSTGARSQIWANLADVARWDGLRVAAEAAHGLDDAPTATWATGALNGLPGHLGRPDGIPRRLFVSRVERDDRYAGTYTAVARLMRVLAPMRGLRLPPLQWIDDGDARPIARWAAAQVEMHGRARINAGVSKAVRIASAATAEGLDLDGVSIVGTGEPATPGKVAAIRGAGARWVPYYAFAEGGAVGFGCADPVDGSDVHLFADRFAVVQTPRRVPGTELHVDAFNFTGLSDGAAKVLLNVEIDDFGILERRDCGCMLGELGYGQHIRQIFSFQKLTGEGVTLVGTDLVRILEEVLPRRFGGNPGDYQLVEEEDDRNLTRLSLVVDPAVQIGDESAVIAAVLRELKETDAPSSMGAAIWAQAGTFRVVRRKPVTTEGKLLPLYSSRRRAPAS